MGGNAHNFNNWNGEKAHVGQQLFKIEERLKSWSSKLFGQGHFPSGENRSLLPFFIPYHDKSRLSSVGVDIWSVDVERLVIL